MKKVKIMLTAVTVFAVVGGALAFKSQKGTERFCVLDGTQSSGTCTAAFTNHKQSGSITYWTTTFVSGESCTNKTCNNTRIALVEN